MDAQTLESERCSVTVETGHPSIPQALPVIRPQVCNREVDLGNIVVGDEILPRGERPQFGVGLDAPPRVDGVEPLLTCGQ